jgi:hypothetical protein
MEMTRAELEFLSRVPSLLSAICDELEGIKEQLKKLNEEKSK